MGLLGQRLTRAANVGWVMEIGDAGAEGQEREARGSTGWEVLLRVCLQCGTSQTLVAAAH